MPQISVTVQFFVTEIVHPVTTSVAIVPVATSPVLQLSVTDAVPKAAATFAAQTNSVSPTPPRRSLDPSLIARYLTGPSHL